MLRLLLALASLVAPVVARAEARWSTNFEGSKSLAKRQGKPLMVALVPEGFGGGGRRLNATLLDKASAAATRGFSPVLLLDSNGGSQFRRRYGLGEGPYVVYLEPSGTLVARTFGSMWPQDLVETSERARWMRANWKRVDALRRQGKASPADLAALAEGYAMRGREPEAAALLAQAVAKKAPASALCNAYTALGDSRRCRYDFVAAAPFYQKALDHSASLRQRRRTQYRLAICYFRTNQPYRSQPILTELANAPDVPAPQREFVERLMERTPPVFGPVQSRGSRR
jgi:putative intracellular protease/amidase